MFHIILSHLFQNYKLILKFHVFEQWSRNEDKRKFPHKNSRNIRQSKGITSLDTFTETPGVARPLHRDPACKNSHVRGRGLPTSCQRSLWNVRPRPALLTTASTPRGCSWGPQSAGLGIGVRAVWGRSRNTRKSPRRGRERRGGTWSRWAGEIGGWRRGLRGKVALRFEELFWK